MTFRFRTLSILLTLVLFVPAAPQAAEPPAAGWPKVALLPFSAPPGLEVLGQTLQRNLLRSLKGQLQVVTVDPAVVQGSGEACIIQPACVDRVLAAAKAEAILTGTLEADPADKTREPQVLLSVTAPAWPIAYVERRASPDEGQVDQTARTLLMIARAQALPAKLEATDAEIAAGDEEGASAKPKKGDRRGNKAAQKAAKEAKEKEEAARKAAEQLARLQREAEEARRAAEEAAGKLEAEGGGEGEEAETSVAARAEREPESAAGEELEDDALAEPDAPSDKERRAAEKRRKEALEAEEARRDKRRQEQIEAREREQRDREEKARAAEKAQERKARKAARPGWPARSPAGPWHGWTLELNGGGAYGALQVSANSQVATSTVGDVVDRYRWAVLEGAPGWAARAGVGLALGRFLEAGVDFAVLPAPRVVQLSFFPEDLPSYKGEERGFDLHMQLAPRLRVFPLPGRAVQPYVGLGLSVRLVPGVESFPEEAGPHDPLGPYQRLGLEPAMGVRVLLKQRLFLNLEGRILLEPGDGFLESELERDAQSVIPVPDLVTPPVGRSAVGSVNVGIGLLL